MDRQILSVEVKMIKELRNKEVIRKKKWYIVVLLGIILILFKNYLIDNMGILILIYFFIALIYKFDFRQSIIAGLVLLILTAFFVEKRNDIANQIAIYAYYFLVAGVVLSIIEYLRKRQDKEEIKIQKLYQNKLLGIILALFFLLMIFFTFIEDYVEATTVGQSTIITFNESNFGEIIIANEYQSEFWSNINPGFVFLSDSTIEKINSSNSLLLEVNKSDRTYFTLFEKKYNTTKDWNNVEYISLWARGDVEMPFSLDIYFNNSYKSEADFSIPISAEWKRYIFMKSRPANKRGNVDWSKVWLIRISNGDKKVTGKFFLDRLVLIVPKDKMLDTNVTDMILDQTNITDKLQP